MKYLTLAPLIFLLLASCANLKTAPKIGTMNVTKKVLDNGLTVLIAPNPKLPIAAYYTLFDVGGRYEGKGTTGATHFLEHMMFKGAKKYGPGEFDTLIERNGGNTNAYTTTDATVYYQTIPAHFVPTMIDLEVDRMQNLMLEPIAFESERQVIFEERKMRYENSPEGMLYLMMMKKTFEKTPYGQSVIGEVKDLDELTRDQMHDFFKKFYVPNNAILAIVGDVDVGKTMELVEKQYGKIRKSSELEAIKKEKESADQFNFKAEFGKSYYEYATNPQAKFMYSFKGDKVGEKRSIALDLLSYMLSNGGSSFLIQKYVKTENQKLTDISLSNYNLRFSGVIYFSGELKEGIDPKVFENDFKKDVKTFCSDAINEKALQKAKNQVMSGAYHQMKTNQGFASVILNNEKYHGDFSYGQKELAMYMDVKLEEVKSACDDVFLNDQGIWVSVWNKYSKTSEIK